MLVQFWSLFLLKGISHDLNGFAFFTGVCYHKEKTIFKGRDFDKQERIVDDMRLKEIVCYGFWLRCNCPYFNQRRLSNGGG